MSVIINIVLILVSLVLIVAVLMQEGNKQGLGAIGGAAETFLGKNKAKGYEGKLLLITKAGAAIFVVLAILATWVNARTWTVRYFVEGEEYFPAHETEIAALEYYEYLGIYTADQIDAQIEELTKRSDEDKRATYAKGDEIYAYEVPAKEGYNGVWDKELPATMDKKDYVLNAVYTIGQYTLSFVDGHYEGDTDATSEEAHEHAALCEPITATYGEPIDAALLPALPEAPEGYTATWSEAIPATMPGYDTTIEVVYELIETEKVVEATVGEAAETTVSEATPIEG